MKPYTDKDKEKLQKNLAVIRKIAGWTSAELGELIGVTKQTISNIENDRTVMTKTQYIAIRSMLDYEISTNPDNVALAQVVNILLDSDELSDEEQVKIDTTIAFAAGAKDKGMTNAAIAAGMAGLITALGIASLPLSATTTAAVIASNSIPRWLSAITAASSAKKYKK